MKRPPVEPRNRLCWPRTHWPAEDQEHWARACTAKSLFDDGPGGELANASSSTRAKYEKGWGRWLAFQAQLDPGAFDGANDRHCSKELIQAYVDHLKACGNSHSTVLNRLQELAVMLKIMKCTFDERALNRFMATTRSRATPVYSKAHIRPANELVALGLDLMDRAQDLASLDDLIAYRDGLIIAFLALHPVRRRNLADFELGRNLVRQSSGYMVIFENTKSGAPYEARLADVLVTKIDKYLREVRPVLQARSGRWKTAVGNAVWVSADGSPMTQEALAGRIKLRTQEAFGKPISPHRFRDAAATFLSVADPARILMAAPLLGHRSLTMTEKHYIQADGLQGQQTYLDVVLKRRGYE